MRPEPGPILAGEPRLICWSSEEYYRLVELGMFLNRRVELVEGQIVEMPTPSNYHFAALSLAGDALRASFGHGFWVRLQGTLDLGTRSVLDPDLAVIPGTPRQNAAANNPTTALLVVEISEMTLTFDRRRKGSLYARAGIADYWVVNLVDRQLEVYRHPVPDAGSPFGFKYADQTVLQPADTVTPLAAPQARIVVADLLP